MRIHLHHPFLFLLILLISVHGGGGAEAAGDNHPQQFDVGVVLDTGTWIGNISWSCMRMAIDDFYAAHPNFTTRLTLHLRRSSTDAFNAASAAIDLMKNVHVQAIIGPQRSSQAKIMIEIGDKAHVPVISFTAQSPSLISKQSPYFIRTSVNDSSQAEAIAFIVQNFKWKEVVPVFEDTDYGTGILPYLIDALQEIDVRVPYRSKIPLSATDDQIRSELNKSMGMQTRVFIVHMSYSLAFRLFSHAKDLGMMGNGYVWITTYALTDILDIMGSSAADVMQGVVGIKPYIMETDKLRDFKVRWGKQFHFKNPNAKVTEPTAFGLWGYDTVWSLALAAESVGTPNLTFIEPEVTNGSTDLGRLEISQNGQKLLKVLQSSKFDGLSGKFHLIEGQLDSKVFEIINVVGNQRRVGIWTPTRHVGLNTYLKPIIWPGDPGKTPKGWEWPTRGRKLKIGVPVKPGFSEFVNILEPKGYCIKVFEAVMAALTYPVPCCEYVLYKNGTYDDLISEVYRQNFDAVVGDVTIIANRSLYVDFTLPFTESGVSMVVPIKDKNRERPWAFLDPLKADLWLTSGAFFAFTGFVVWFLEHRINDEFRGKTIEQLGTVFYFSFSTLVFAHREKVVSNLSRVVVIVWVFVVLILTSSYTASLTSILTAQQLEPTVNNIEDLIRNGSYVGYLSDSFMPALLKRMNFNSAKLIAYNSPDEYNMALSNGTVAAIIDEIPYIKVFLSQYCNKYTMVGPTYKTDGFGFVFPRGSLLVPDVSRAILEVMQNKTMEKIENELYVNGTCVHQSGGGLSFDQSGGGSRSLSFKSFWGLFLITGATSMFALLLNLLFYLYEHVDVLRSDSPASEKLALLLKLYGPKVTSSDETKNADAGDGGDIAPTPSLFSGPQSPSSLSISTHGNFELEGEAGDTSEGEGTPGREISSQSPGPPSFADMLNVRS